MDFFEDNLLEDVINFKGKKKLREREPVEDEGKSQSSDEIYIFKRQGEAGSESSSDAPLKRVLSKPTASLFIHQHL